jgi:hypothetical protein
MTNGLGMLRVAYEAHGARGYVRREMVPWPRPGKRMGYRAARGLSNRPVH